MSDRKISGLERGIRFDRHAFFISPLGPLRVAVRGEQVVEVCFVPDALQGDEASPGGVLEEAIGQLRAYFDGTLRAFDLPLQVDGTPFQQRVWSELCRIPYGERRTYGQIAAAIGAPRACRAVGMANHRNPLSLVVPCHRVVGAFGASGGYAAGVERKEWLLEWERRGGEL